MKFDQIRIGMEFSIKKRFTHKDVDEFAKLSEDRNPLHLNEEFAKRSIFKGKIVHGMLYSSLISAIFGNNLPGSIYLKQSLEFLKPVKIDDEITAIVKIKTKIDQKNIFVCETICKNQEQEHVVVGEATMLLKD